MNKYFHKFLRGRIGAGNREKIKRIQYQTQMDQRLVQNLSGAKRLPSLKQLKYVSKYLSKTESLLIKIIAPLLVFAVMALAVNLYWINSYVSAAAGGEYTEGLIGSPQYINPVLAQTNDVDLDLSYLIFSGLLRFDPSQGLVPDLASSIQISDDQKEYTLSLREGLSWDDGEKLTVDDVIFTVDRIKDPKAKSPLIFNFSGVSVERIDDRTVKFKLEEVFAPFMESLTVGILPEHVWIDIPAENMNLAETNIKPVGCGKYKVKSIYKEKNGAVKIISLTKNKLYHGQQPYIETLTFKFYPDFTSAIDALNNKNIEGISYLPEKNKSDIFNNRSLNFYQFSLPQYIALFINLNVAEILKDKNVRQALASGVNKNEIVESIYQNSAIAIDSPILEGFIGYNQDIKKYGFDIEQAKKILDDAGWKLSAYPTSEGSDPYPFQVRKKGDQFLELAITLPAQTEYEKIAKSIQQSWQQIGVKTNLEILDAAQIQRDKIKDRNFGILLYGEILGTDPDPYPFWHSTQCKHPGLNLSCFKNAKADKLLEEARKTTNTEDRQTKYVEFQNIIAEELPAIFLINTTYTYPISKKIQGIETHQIIMPAHRYAGISDWYVNTDRRLGKKSE
ncbi:MAG: ABC transporter substrate-binding protein [Patescibacteria group bacterium]